MDQNRRHFIKQFGIAAAGAGLLHNLSAMATGIDGSKKHFFEISLAEWSLHRTLESGKMTNMDFPTRAKKEFQISAVEYVDQFFKDKAKNQKYLSELKQRTSDLGVRNVLIMIDTAGPLAELNEAERKQAVENHYQWVDAAKFLECHSIRVNLRGKGTADEAGRASIESLGRLSEYGAKNEIGIIVENHGGYSSDIKWLTNIIRQVNNPYCGTLPDFGNFCIEQTDKKCINEYDRYLGVQEMLPYAKGISAKSLDFDEKGDETKIDFLRMFKMIKKEKPASFKGFVGIEYSGSVLSEDEGIRKTKQLLEKVGQMIS
ncbi:MAG TPA: TIM barrel protein [Flavitalea sp.]|nr:TIM barrel protein [Flavitalea sp.]